MTTELFSIDVAAAREAVAGAAGVADGELDGLVARGRQVHDDLLLARARGQIGFADLYMLGREAMRARDAAESLASRFEYVVAFSDGAEADVMASLLDALAHPYHNLLPSSGRAGRPQVLTVDTTDPDRLAAFVESFAVEQALALCISKDGAALGALVQFAIVRDMLRMRVGPGYQDHLVVVTDPTSGPLREEALRDGLMSFEIPRNVPARYSVLTPVALLPGAMAGADVRGVLSGAHAAAEQTAGEDLRTNPAYLLAATLHTLASNHGCRQVVFAAGCPTLSGTARQAARLLQESVGCGRQGAGTFSCSEVVLPRDLEALASRCLEGPRDVAVVMLDSDKRSRDRLLPKNAAGLGGLAGKSLKAISAARTEALKSLLGSQGVPVIDVRLPTVAANTFGALHMAFMLAASFGARLIAPDAPAAIRPTAEARLKESVSERLGRL